ncbi:hypothetical protein BS78_05G201100 [Paspalum vaginatum]|nr:hypothetical protein BS78_05G201100 [Paspalum vaginatum]
MPRKKVNLQWISNTSTRHSTYKRRLAGLEKKVSELATLCNVKVGLVVYGEGEAQPVVWPSNKEEAKQFLIEFKEMPEVGGFKKATTQESYLESRGSKLHEQVCKLQHENQKSDTLYLLHESISGCRLCLTGTSENDHSSLKNVVEMKMRKVTALLQNLVGKQGALPELPLVPPPISSSSQTWASSYTHPEMQRMAPLEEHPHLQQDWQVTGPTMNDGELSAMFSNVFAGSSSGPSISGCDGMQPYNLGPYSGIPQEE